MHPLVLARSRVFDVLPASLRPLRSEDMNCDSRRELLQARTRIFPGNPGTHVLPGRKLPPGTSSERYVEIEPPVFLPAGRRSRQRERSMETCCGSEPGRASRAAGGFLNAQRCPRPRAFAPPGWLCSVFHHPRFRHCAAYIPRLRDRRTAAVRSAGERLRLPRPVGDSGCAPGAASWDLRVHSVRPPSSANVCRETRLGMSSVSTNVGKAAEGL